jgi:hypothetical protein
LLPNVLLQRPKAIQKLRQDEEYSNTLRRLANWLDLDRSLAARGLMERGVADRVLHRVNGRGPKSALNDLWGLICAELWTRTFCDQRGAAPVDLAAL